jgi:plasmid maintenance system killer protein
MKQWQLAVDSSGSICSILFGKNRAKYNGTTASELRLPPGNQLETLSGDRAGQHSIRINDQYRICFIWRDNEPDEVEITDYH